MYWESPLDEFKWLQDASCRGLRTRLFFEDFEDASLTDKIKTLKYCAGCPVIEECYDYAMSNKKTEGIYGGKFFRNGVPKNPMRIHRSKREKVAA